MGGPAGAAVHPAEPGHPDEIAALILDCGLRSGDPLPTETELVESLGVSRNSVREALKALQALDIVEIRHGYGTYVGKLSLDPLADGLTFRVLHGMTEDMRAMQEILEVRSALEDSLVRRVAADGIPDGDVAELGAVVERMAALAAEGAEFAEEDREFHEVLYRSLDNALVTQLLRAFWNVFHRVNDRLGATTPDPAETVRRHRAIVAAVVARDVSGAERAMSEHFQDVVDQVERVARGRQ
ncbi:FadR/GntR family transcriptional regulator [Kibdelosporangium lantanae]